MGFLNWFSNQEPEESQIDLFGNSQALTPHERVDGATVKKDFDKAIKDCGGSKQAHANAVEAETRELFGCGTKELYEGTGGKRGDRSSLPADAQKAYIVTETVATNRLNRDRNSIDVGSQSYVDEKIVDTVRDTAKETKGFFPWNW